MAICFATGFPFLLFVMSFEINQLITSCSLFLSIFWLVCEAMLSEDGFA
jgi:hypothetical protein